MQKRASTVVLLLVLAGLYLTAPVSAQLEPELPLPSPSLTELPSPSPSEIPPILPSPTPTFPDGEVPPQDPASLPELSLETVTDVAKVKPLPPGTGVVVAAHFPPRAKHVIDGIGYRAWTVMIGSEEPWKRSMPLGRDRRITQPPGKSWYRNATMAPTPHWS